ncbi:MAG: OsmC family protein [Firmicutes bacterium]|nr:OsmC family protein [Bacillota bacterium]
MADVRVSWQENMNFVGQDDSGHMVSMDAGPIYGGMNQGIRPMELLLTAVAGCSGIELTHILNKMRISFDSLVIDVKGQRAEDHPKIFTGIQIIYRFTGHGLIPGKVNQALKLTDETYCSVSNMVNKAAEISYSFEINGERYDYPFATSHETKGV